MKKYIAVLIIVISFLHADAALAFEAENTIFEPPMIYSVYEEEGCVFPKEHVIQSCHSDCNGGIPLNRQVYQNVIPPEHVIPASEPESQEVHQEHVISIPTCREEIPLNRQESSYGEPEIKWYKPWSWDVNWKTIGVGVTEVAMGTGAVVAGIELSAGSGVILSFIGARMVVAGLVEAGTGITTIVYGLLDRDNNIDLLDKLESDVNIDGAVPVLNSQVMISIGKSIQNK